MGVVYAAYDPELDRKIAIKLLRPSAASASDRTRLLREAQAMARLQHPNVIAVHDVGTFEDQVFVAMEYVEGETLTAWLAQPRSWRESLAALREAGRGLAAAHAAGIVHRDFKPDNVLVGKDGRMRVLDFGLARAQDDPAEAGSKPNLLGGSAPGALDTPLTRTGTVLGTPAYMAPEQFHGDATDARSDQFGFCIAVYQALYGERPFEGNNLLTLAKATAEGRVRPEPTGSRVPGWLRQIVLRGLRARPEERWPSMEALLTALAREPEAARRRWLAVAGTLVGLSALGVGYRAVRERQQGMCAGAEARLSGVWDDARKQAVHAAFAATGKSYAEPVFRSASFALDAYARKWTSMRSDACEATKVRREQSDDLLDLRMQCFENRREELQALTDLFTKADGQILEKATQAAEGLSRLEDCSRASTLRAPRPPVDPSVRAQVVSLRKQLARAKALLPAGKYEEGLRIAQATADAAEKLRYRPLQAETLVMLGTFQHRRGDYAKAEGTFREGALAAEAAGDFGAMTDSSVSLLKLVGYELARIPEGHEWARRAAADLEYLGRDELRSAELFDALGALLGREGKHEESLALHRKALPLFEKELGPGASDTLGTRYNVGLELDNVGRSEEALAQQRETLSIQEKTLGADHPDLAETHSGLGTVLDHLGRREEALAELRRGLALAEAALGPDHPELSMYFNNIGEELLELDRYDEASQQLRRALALAEKGLGPTHPDLAYELNGLGLAALGLRRPLEALPFLERALTLREREGERIEPALLAGTRFLLARALWESGQDRARARALATRARATYAADSARGTHPGRLAEVDAWLAGHVR
jgi:tetratricopeptide (TPR) repeat protein/predicted Ser/Thr protein kinase